MKKYFYFILAGIFIALILCYGKMCADLQKYKNLYNKELLNTKAYEAQNSELNNEVREFKFTMDELRASNDSVNKRLIQEIDRLKLKDKNIKYLQYNTSVIHKVDTIHLNDTIFKEPLAIDTIVGDEWYTMQLGLKYPSTIITKPTFNSEKYVIINTKREYNKKPSKFFFIRWFQKKHTVVTVNIEEKNPYIENKYNKFIDIVK